VRGGGLQAASNGTIVPLDAFCKYDLRKRKLEQMHLKRSAQIPSFLRGDLAICTA